MTILGDWGTTRLRLFLAQGDAIVDRLDGPGIGMRGTEPASVLADALAPWIKQHGARHVLLCGMAGSRNGLAEAPYAPCPADSAAWGALTERLMVAGAEIGIAPGLECLAPSGAPDVMRGEETQLFGAMAIAPELGQGRHVVALPGTHSKWALLNDGGVLHFQTWFTGELFALLRDQSTLTRAGEDDGGFDAGFDAGLTRGLDEKRGVVGAVFEARSAQLRQGRTRGWATGFLSGLLIGAELAEASAAFEAPASVSLIGDSALSTLYRRAFERAGITTTQMDGDACSIAGLRALAHLIEWNAR